MANPSWAPGAPICRLEDFGSGTVLERTLGEGRGALAILLARQGDEVAAYRNRCPHFQIPLNARPGAFLSPGEGQIMCAFHSAVFRLSDGLCIDGPCKGARLEPVAVARQGDLIVAA